MVLHHGMCYVITMLESIQYRINISGAVIGDIQLYVSTGMPTNELSPDVDLKAKLCETPGVAHVMTIDCDQTGSVVSVFLDTGNPLCLCEVEVYGVY